LFYKPSGNNPAVDDTGTGNVVSNNTSASTTNAGFVNVTGKFGLISDFKPAANYTGGVAVPVLTDAMGTAWGPWDLCTVHH
jgi:hypothetical protein